MGFVVGKVLQVIGMLTLGVALFVYGFGENDMNAELGWLLVGSALFLVGTVLARRDAGGSSGHGG